jgi:hypothetical protein
MRQGFSRLFPSSASSLRHLTPHPLKRRLVIATAVTSSITLASYTYYCYNYNTNLSFFHTVYGDEPATSPSTSASPSPSPFRGKADRTKKMFYYSGKVSGDARDDMKLVAGNGNRDLAEEIGELLGVALCEARVGKFSDGETSIQILENIRGKHIFIIQPTSYPVNDMLTELLLLISTCRRASARQITAVIPYYSYSRSDKKMTSRVPIAAADVAKMIEEMGCDNVITIDLHAGQIQGTYEHISIHRDDSLAYLES